MTGKQAEGASNILDQHFIEEVFHTVPYFTSCCKERKTHTCFFEKH